MVRIWGIILSALTVLCGIVAFFRGISDLNDYNWWIWCIFLYIRYISMIVLSVTFIVVLSRKKNDIYVGWLPWLVAWLGLMIEQSRFYYSYFRYTEWLLVFIGCFGCALTIAGHIWVCRGLCRRKPVYQDELSAPPASNVEGFRNVRVWGIILSVLIVLFGLFGFWDSIEYWRNTSSDWTLYDFFNETREISIIALSVTFVIVLSRRRSGISIGWFPWVVAWLGFTMVQTRFYGWADSVMCLGYALTVAGNIWVCRDLCKRKPVSRDELRAFSDAPLKPPASAVVCSSCHRPLKDDAKFCDKCGAPVSKEPPPAATKKCKTKGCGREYPPDIYFCDVCGARL